MVNYNKLWKKIIDCGLNRTQLKDKAGVSTNVIAKLGKNEAVSLDSLAKICKVLACDIGDVAEFINPPDNKYSVIDLFSGAGGLHMGFMAEHFDIKLCVDNDVPVSKTHMRNFPNIPFLNDDIRKIPCERFQEYLGANQSIDIIIGGPPCQGFSTIGKRASSNPDKRMQHDTRNELVLIYANIIKTLKPKFIVMENVKGILTKDNGEYLKTLCSELTAAGYRVGYKIINMADYGVPQIRERVIVIGNRLGLPVAFPKPTHAEKPTGELLPWVSCWNVLEDLVEHPEDKAFNHVALKHTDVNIERYKLIPEGGRLPEDKLPPEIYRRNFGNTYKRLSRFRPALTMVPGNDAFPIHPVLHRSLTVREAARIQTFPDNFIFEGNRRQQGHQVGNAVPPAFSVQLAAFMLTQLKMAEGKL